MGWVNRYIIDRRFSVRVFIAYVIFAVAVPNEIMVKLVSGTRPRIAVLIGSLLRARHAEGREYQWV